MALITEQKNDQLICLNELVDVFGQNQDPFDSNIFHGSLGIVLFEMFYLKYFENEKLNSNAIEKILNAYKLLLNSEKRDECGGEVINGWLLCFLVNNDLIELELDTMLEDIDHYICVKVQTTFCNEVNDLFLRGYYLYERLQCTNNDFIKRSIIESIAYVLEEISYLQEQFDNVRREASNFDIRREFQFQTLSIFYINRLQPYKIYTHKQQELEDSLLNSYLVNIQQFFELSCYSDCECLEVYLKARMILNLHVDKNNDKLKKVNGLLNMAIDSLIPKIIKILSVIPLRTKVLYTKLIKNMKDANWSTVNLDELGSQLIQHLTNVLAIKVWEKKCNHIFTNKGLGGLSGLGLNLLEYRINERIPWDSMFLLF
jgi:hypothetical protein